MALIVTAEFQWNVQNRYELLATFAWQVGDGPLYWYRVESKPLPPYGLSCKDDAKALFIRTQYVLAYSIKHLAQQLKAQRFNAALNIEKLHRWTLPALECDIKNLTAAGVKSNMTCPTFESIGCRSNNPLWSSTPCTQEVSAKNWAYLSEFLCCEDLTRIRSSISSIDLHLPASPCAISACEATIGNTALYKGQYACKPVCHSPDPNIPDVPLEPFSWFTEYKHVVPYTGGYYIGSKEVPGIGIGDVVIPGQIIGQAMPNADDEYPPYLEFAVKDCNGCSLDITSLFFINRYGTRTVSSPCTSIFNVALREYVFSHTFWPVDTDWGEWFELYDDYLSGGSINTGDNYNNMYWVVGPMPPNSPLRILGIIRDESSPVVGRGPPRTAEDAWVYCAGGGFDVTNTVVDIVSPTDPIAGGSVKIKHTWQGPGCASGCESQQPGQQQAFAFSLASPTPTKLTPMNNMVRTEVSGYLPMSLDVEVSRFGKDKLYYNATSDSWHKQNCFRVDSCLCELSSRTRLGSSFWQLAFRMVKNGKRSELVATFFPNNFRQSGGKFQCEFTLNSGKVECDVATQSVMVKDELGIFQSPVTFDIKA